MKLDKEQVNEVLGQKSEWASVRAEMVWCCQMHKEAMEQYTGQGGVRTLCNCLWQACELRHGTWGNISVFKSRCRDAE